MRVEENTSAGKDRDRRRAARRLRWCRSVRAGGRRYRLTPPVCYVVLRRCKGAVAVATAFPLHAHGWSPRGARKELRRHLAALIEGYALEDDARLSASGQRLKQHLLSRLIPVGC